jgi:hypothetical protein
MKTLKPTLAATAIALFLTSPALAQKGPETYTLNMTPAEVNAVGIALMQRPYSEVAELMNKLNDQVKKQNDAAGAKAEPAKPPAPTTPPAKK